MNFGGKGPWKANSILNGSNGSYLRLFNGVLNCGNGFKKVNKPLSTYSTHTYTTSLVGCRYSNLNIKGMIGKRGYYKLHAKTKVFPYSSKQYQVSN
jgi:hypothetical protein